MHIYFIIKSLFNYLPCNWYTNLRLVIASIIVAKEELEGDIIFCVCESNKIKFFQQGSKGQTFM